MHDDRFARLPEPPYYAVIFSSRRRGDAAGGYAEAATRMEELVATQPGFLGAESARDGGIQSCVTNAPGATVDDQTTA